MRATPVRTHETGRLVDMQTKKTDVRTDDARPLLSSDMTIAAGWLARAANQLAIAECNSVVPGDPDAVRVAVNLSKTYALHAMAIVLGEVDSRSQPRSSPVRADDGPSCNVCGEPATNGMGRLGPPDTNVVMLVPRCDKHRPL